MHAYTDTKGQSWPRGTGSVGDSVGEGTATRHLTRLLGACAGVGVGGWGRGSLGQDKLQWTIAFPDMGAYLRYSHMFSAFDTIICMKVPCLLLSPPLLSPPVPSAPLGRRKKGAEGREGAGK